MADLGLKPEEIKKRILILRASWQMYEKTLVETERSMRLKLDKNGNKYYSEEQITEQLESIKFAQKEVLDEYKMFGGKEEELTLEFENDVNSEPAKKKKVRSNKIKNVLDLYQDTKVSDKTTEYKETKPVTDAVKELEDKKKPKKEAKKHKDEDILTKVERQKVKYVDYEKNNGFDLIPLPSKGRCYDKRLNIPAKIAVAPLCGYDEDMIHAPGLYNDNKILDMLLKEKIIDKSIDPSDLLDGDREAILLWLRADGYGNDYAVTTTDNKTGESFETNIDLSEIKYKDFTLESDSEGLFEYKMPKSGDLIKFKFLNHNEKESLMKLEESEVKTLVKERLKTFVETMDNFIETYEEGEVEKSEIKRAIRKIESWQMSIDDEDSQDYTHGLSNTIEMSIVSVNGERDRLYIHDYVKNMPVLDSRSFREYVTKNEPGVDYHFTIEVPESLGGGSRTVFLQFHKYIFLNVS